MDTGKSSRLKRQKQLNTVFRTIMEESHQTLGATRCTLFLYDKEKEMLWSKYAVGKKEFEISMD
eukprot:Pgem_evm1s14516